jgi:anti-sigma B factor antagonist
VLAVSGELDLAAAPSLEEELDRVFGSEVELIVLDLKGLDFIDSTGLSVLVRGHQRAQESGREFGLVNPTSQVERLLTLTGLADRLTLSDQQRSESA